LILVHPKFQGPRCRTFRVCIFVGTGLSGLAPLLHGIIVFGFSNMVKQSGMPYYFAKGFFLLLGTLFYAVSIQYTIPKITNRNTDKYLQKRIPEALKPGKFDIFGASHQIFHLLVVFATVVQLVGILSAFDYNYNRTCSL
jgi:adiponectin receptor